MKFTDADYAALLADGSDFGQSLYAQRGRWSPKQETWAVRIMERNGRTPGMEDVRFQKPPFPPNEEQQEALDRIMAKLARTEHRGLENRSEEQPPMIGLTGAAGTGKSFTTAWLAYMLQEAGYVSQFAATTHQAATVVSRGGVPCRTIHSLCGLIPHTDGTVGYASSGQGALATGAVLVLDEASMADPMLIRAIRRRARSSGTRLVILIGDASQLPPVAAPDSMFTDVLLQKDCEVLELKTVMRNAGMLANVLEGYRKGGHANDWPEPAEEGGQRIALGSDSDVEAFLREGQTWSPDGVLSCVVVAYTNARVNQINVLGRKIAYGEEAAKAAFLPGEKLVSNSVVIDPETGKTVLENSRVVTVIGATEDAEIRGLWRLRLKDGLTGRALAYTFKAATGVAPDIMLNGLEEAAQARENELRDILDAFVPAEHSAALTNFLRTRSRDALAQVVACISEREVRETVFELDEERRRRWKAFYEVKTGLADLRPMWARTVHKSQGLTVDRVLVDVPTIDGRREEGSEPGEEWRALAYVAMSRAKREVVLLDR